MERNDFEQILERLPLVVYSYALDERSSARWITPQIDELLGYTREEWLADPDLYVRSIHRDDRERVLEQIARRNATGECVNDDYRLVRRDGAVIWVREEEIVVRDSSGVPTHVEGYAQDVTQWHRERERASLIARILALAADEVASECLIAETAELVAAAVGDDLTVTFLEVSEGFLLTPRYTTSPHGLPTAYPVIPESLERLDRGPLVVEDVLLEPWLEQNWPVLEARGVRSAVDVPIRRNGRIVALMWFNTAEPRRWPADEVQTLVEAAHQLGVVLDRAQAREQREQAAADLRARDAILDAITVSAEKLLAEPCWRMAASDVLELLGSALGASRAYVFENRVDEAGEVRASQRLEWAAGGISTELDNPVMQEMSFAEVGLARFAELVGGDSVYAAVVRDLPPDERALFEAQEIRSIMAVPIFVGDEWWGFIGFDDCVSEREWSTAETDALRTAASLLSAAIRRERSEATLREHEQKLRAVFDTALDAIFIIDTERRYVDANPAACELLGIAKRDLIGRPLDDFVAPERLPTLDSEWHAYLAGGPATSEKQIRRADGEIREVDVSARPHFLPGLTIAFARDITDKKRLESELLSAQKLESIGRLAGGVAHDFNNLLTAIGGYTSLLLERANGDAMLAHDLGEIRRATDRATELTQQLLAFARRQMLQPRVLDLNEVLTDVGSLLSRLLGEHVELVLEPSPRPATVRADPGQLEQVIVNLAVNARDAMPDGGRLSLTVRATAEVVELVAHDTGIGMDPETLGHVFEPFFTTREEGVGLGLASVYGIVRQSGGDVIAASEPGRGATFTVRLPRVDEEPTVEEPPPPADTRTGEETILLVEDEDVVRTLARRVLERCGYTVLACADGAEAVELAERHAEPIDLLLTDVVMPGLRGHEVAELVAASRPGIKVLYMSGYADAALLGAAAIAGPALIEKPFGVEALAGRVREALEPQSGTIPATRA